MSERAAGAAAADTAVCDALLGAFVADPAGSVVIVDFDGTLAPIVDDPATSAALPGVADVLARLVRCVGTVAVVSGRPVDFLRDALPVDGLTLRGHYGLERFDGGVIDVEPAARAWVDTVRAAVAEAEAALPGIRIERKGRLALALHWRERPALEAAATALAHRLAREHGLHLEPGRRTIELRPPLDIDKGTTTTDLTAGRSAALLIGDDRGDLAAFEAAAALLDSGRLRTAVRVAVRSAESPPELLAAADLEVDGPQGVLALLAALADRLEER